MIKSTVITAKPAVMVMMASALRISGLSSFLDGKGAGSLCPFGSFSQPINM